MIQPTDERDSMVIIVYHGRLRDPSLVSPLVEEVADYAEALGWSVHRHDRLNGIVVYPHEECDPLTLSFDSEGVLQNLLLEGTEYSRYHVIITENAPLEIHLSLCNLLQHLKDRYFRELAVEDERRYLETDDRPLLESIFRALEAAHLKLVAEPEDMPGEEEDWTLFDRLNGPEPPYFQEEWWDMDRWIDFWRRWDEHHSCLVGTENAVTLADIEAAIAWQKEALEQRERDMAEFLENAARENEELDRQIAEEDEQEDKLENESVSRSVRLSWDYKRQCMQNDTDGSNAYGMACTWLDRLQKLEKEAHTHPVLSYVISATDSAVVGTRMAVFYKWADDHFDSVPSRFRVNVMLFERVVRVLRIVNEPTFTLLAGEAYAIAQAFRDEVGE